CVGLPVVIACLLHVFQHRNLSFFLPSLCDQDSGRGFGLISAQRNRARRHTAYTAYGAAKINHQGESCDLREPKFLLISLLFSRHYPMLKLEICATDENTHPDATC